jgi:predicted enzyme related to lactoylglutathione lyase
MPISLVWADVPVVDLERARRFYSTMLDAEVNLMPGEGSVALVPSDNGISVDLALNSGLQPSATQGPTIYFSSNGDIDGMLERVVQAGGTVVAGKQFMGPMVGWVAFVVDTEGNRIGVQQPASETEGASPRKASD